MRIPVWEAIEMLKEVGDQNKEVNITFGQPSITIKNTNAIGDWLPKQDLSKLVPKYKILPSFAETNDTYLADKYH